MKKKVLIASYPLDVGGTTTALLSLLHHIDYEKYDIDLILARNEGDFIPLLPKEVNLLSCALQERGNFTDKIKKLFIYMVKGVFLKCFVYKYLKKNTFPLAKFQILSGYGWAEASRRLRQEYDVAIGFMEGWPNVFIAKKTHAKKKLAWIHPEYKSSGLDPALDEPILKKFDKIVLVTEKCKEVFNDVFPLLSGKTAVVENIVSPSYIKKLADMPEEDFNPDSGCLNIITAARLSLADKGLDRGVYAMGRLKAEGYKVRWFVLGGGRDRQRLEDMIKENNLENEFVLLGERVNPYPYIKKADVFVLTSRYEGKPIAVTEAQILGVPVITTEYASAREQVNHGIDGIITPNDDTAIYDGIKKVLENRDLLLFFENNLAKCPGFGSDNIDAFYNLINNQ